MSQNISQSSGIVSSAVGTKGVEAWAQARINGDLKKAKRIKAFSVAAARQDGSHIDMIADELKPLSADRTFHSPDARNVVEVIDYGQDVVVKTKVAGSTLANPGGGKRGVIKELSPASIKRLKLHLRNVPEGYTHFLTLTYPDIPTDGREVKYHLQRMRQWLQRNGVKDGTWWLEFQRRGSPHFHAAIKGHPCVTSLRVAAAWCRIIGQSLQSNCFKVHAGRAKGNSRPCLEWIKKPHAISYYATKYACKPEQKEVPEDYQDVGRFWGVWGKLRPRICYTYGRGYDSVTAAMGFLRDWRVHWKIEAGVRLDEKDLKLRFSGTMWGGAEHLVGLMDNAGWAPF